MTPHRALKRMKAAGVTLEEVQKMLGKKRVQASVATLSRIRKEETYEPGRKLWDAIVQVYEAWDSSVEIAK